MRITSLAAFAAALALSACSEKTKDNAAETVTSAGKDISAAATDTRDAASEGADKASAAMDRVEEAADRMGSRIKQGAGEAKDALKPKPSETPH